MDREFLHLERTQNGWYILFQKLHQIARTNAGTQLLAKKPMNIIRNRYRDVLPIDDTRVKLDDEENDYINANYVKVEEVNRTYILTQGPLQHTCAHFWEMVWEQNTAAIVMLNKCVERGMNKCSPYWPQDDQQLQFGHFQVESLGAEDEPSYRLSHLKLENLETNESRVVLHFHYTRWPDFGVPQTADVFLDFLYAVRNSGALGQDVGPCVVHCSAGIGRSGTFCLVDVCLAKLEQTRDLASLDIQQILLDMRRQRLGLIQTPDQLRFSYFSVLQGAIQILGIEHQLLFEQELSESEEDDLEEESESGSESEEDEDDDARMERKYPNLTRNRGASFDDDVPPPIPPRPPELLDRPPPPSMPPPPSIPPPGPPRTHTLDDQESQSKRMKLENEGGDEEFGFTVNAAAESEGEENGEVLEESGSEAEEQPPPIPPRNKSRTPEWAMGGSENGVVFGAVGGGGGNRDIYGDEIFVENSTGHFLSASGGRGKRALPPHVGHHPSEEESTPPPLPVKKGKTRRSSPPVPPQNIEDEEQALLSELNELERLVSQERRTEIEGRRQEVASRTGPRPNIDESSQSELRRRDRADKQARVTSQLNSMKERLQKHEEEVSEAEWSVSWLMLGFVAMIGYCVYYFFFS